jgi:RHS repeat-associated protein
VPRPTTSTPRTASGSGPGAPATATPSGRCATSTASCYAATSTTRATAPGPSTATTSTAAAQLLAAETGAGVRHFHLDHLGSPRLITNAAKQQVAYHTYLPCGEEWTGVNQDAERAKFTGHERDLGVLTNGADDVDYMHARFGSPLTGRFLSPDPLLGSFVRPSSWNRYAYVYGNPIRWVDRFGLEGEDAPGVENITISDSITVIDQAISVTGSSQSRFGSFLYRSYRAGGVYVAILSLRTTSAFLSFESYVNRSLQDAPSDPFCLTLPSGGQECMELTLAIMPYGPGGGLKVQAGSRVGRLLGKPFPEKMNMARLQPYNPANGRYLGYEANPGPGSSVTAHFGVGFAQGFSSGYTNVDLPPVRSVAHGRGQVLGQLLGTILGGL